MLDDGGKNVGPSEMTRWDKTWDIINIENVGQNVVQNMGNYKEKTLLKYRRPLKD